MKYPSANPTASLAALPLAEHAAAPHVATQHSHRDRAIRRLLMVSDLTALVIGVAVLALASKRPSFDQALLWGLPTLPFWIALFMLYGLYRRDQTRIGHTTVDDVPVLFHAMLLGCPLLWFYLRFLPGDDHFGKVLAFGVAAGVAAMLLRGLARSLGGRVIAPERLLLIGQQEEMTILVRKLQSHPGYGVEPVGRVNAPGEDQAAVRGGVSWSATDPELDLPLLGNYSNVDLRRLAAEHRIDRVVISHTDVEEPALLELLRLCKELSIKVSVLPQLSDAMGPAAEIDEVSGLTLIAITPPVLSPSARAAKRVMDLVGAGVVLLLCLPLMALIAVAIKLDSPGPVLFRQERVGRRGRLFELLKFRTMSVDAEQLREALLAQSKEPGWLHLEHDPRVTRVGRLLRRCSLDELPQLWNVLRGEMSLVGPRPLIPSEDANLVGWARARLDLMPGLSGLWQVLGRTRIPFPEMIKLDYLYVTNWSLWGDVRLILRTIPAVLLRRGAN